MSNVGIVILCRYSSSRLPGKILMEIDNKSILKHIVDRVSLAVPNNKIIVATSKEASDDKIANYCNKENINLYRGSLSNVAKRFYEAGNTLNTKYICRINGDNFFIDPVLLRYMIRDRFIENHLFISNVPGRSFPYGMSIEIVSKNYYKKVLELIDTERYREHVTLYLYEQGNQENQRLLKNTFFSSLKGVNLAVDTKEDFERVKKLYFQLKESELSITGKNIAKIINRNNEL